jgi:hypothetical protein
MANVIPEDPIEVYDPSNPDSQIREYIRLSQSITALDERKKELRDVLMQLVDNEGYEDGNGNMQYEFSSPIDGAVRLEKQRRSTRKLDEEKAEEIIFANNLGDAVYKMVRVIDEDALMAAHYEGNITEEEIDEMFPVVIVWALRAPKK